MTFTEQSPREEAGAEISIKHEAPDYQTSLDSPTSSPVKRRRSDHSQDGGDKRQRIDSAAAIEDQNLSDPSSLSIADLAAQASEAVMQQFLAANQESTSPPQPELSDAPASVESTDHNRSVSDGNDFISDPYLYMRILSLPMLESLSTQILVMLAQGPCNETIKMVYDPDSELGQAYTTLKALFDQTKRIYSEDGLFLYADELDIKEPEHRTTIRLTNLASFSVAVFASSAGFYELSSSFIDIVTPEGACLEKEPGELLVNLKTQMYLSMVTSEEQPETKEDILEEMFPFDFEHLLKQRHPDIPLSGDELEFIKLVTQRRDFLMKEHTDVESTQALSEKFSWEGFLTSVSTYLRNHYKPLLGPYMKRHALTIPVVPRRTSHQRNPEDHSNPANGLHIVNTVTSPSDQDISVHAQQAADEVLKALGYTDETQAFGPQTEKESRQSQEDLGDTANAVPYPTQSAPTQELYEKARRAASSKASNCVRRPGISQRRPWSTEEENTLMAGLDQVKGPYWSQILALYGSSGTLNDILRDRNQVQLKDKARNLKLFFLKSGIEVPYYLQCVTGELKTRAPSQAAKREAEQRARLASDDEQMRQEGISALTGMAYHAHDRDSSGSLSSEASDYYDGSEGLQVVEPQQNGDEPIQEPVQPQTAPVAQMVTASPISGDGA